jgi:hypothetical protein
MDLDSFLTKLFPFHVALWVLAVDCILPLLLIVVGAVVGALGELQALRIDGEAWMTHVAPVCKMPIGRWVGGGGGKGGVRLPAGPHCVVEVAAWEYRLREHLCPSHPPRTTLCTTACSASHGS